MASKKARLTGIVLLAIGLAALGTAATVGTTTPPYASFEGAVPGLMPRGADENAIYFDQAGNQIPTPGTDDGSAEMQGLWCTPVSGRDNPHRSGADVSGHGWWSKGTCSNNLADVYNCLYEWYTDNSWRLKSCSSIVRVAPGGGSGNRSTARTFCHSSALTSWRNHVDVNVVDEWDTPEQPYNQAAVTCRVF